MPKFSEIFQKLESTEEYNKYPFMLAVATQDTLCQPPIPGKGYLDRAFITSTGGCSKIKIRETEDYRNEDSRPEEQYYYYSDRVLHPARDQEILEKYSFWIPKKVFLREKDFGTHAVLTSICNFLNKATGNDISIIRDWEIPIDLQYDIYPEIESFIDKATEFIQLELTASTLIDAVREKVSALRKVADDLDKALDGEPSEWEDSYYGAEYHNGGMTGDPHGESWCRVFFGISKEYWKNTLSMLNEISTFDFDKKFAYCDIAGRQQHIAALADILSQQSLCLFYSKWKELFTWFSNRMQPIPLNKPIPEAEDTLALEELSKLCDYDFEKSIMPQFCFSYTYLNNTPQILPCQQLPNYIKAKGEISKALAAKNAAWIPVNPINESVRSTLPNGETSQFHTIMKNLFWLYRNNKSPLNADIELNSTVIAKTIRLFAEYSLKLLYYMGYLPMASINEIQRYDKKTKRPLFDPKTGHPLTRKEEWVYYIAKDERIVSGVFYILQSPVLSEIANSRNQSLSQISMYLNMIHALTDGKNNELMHNDGFFTSKEVSDSLDRIRKITTWLQSLLQAAPGSGLGK